MRKPLKFLKFFRLIKLTRSFNDDKIRFIDFFRVVNGDDPFFTQFYGKMTTQKFAVIKIYLYCLKLIRHVRFIKQSTRRKRKKIGCNVSRVNNDFTRVAFRNYLLLQKICFNLLTCLLTCS